MLVGRVVLLVTLLQMALCDDVIATMDQSRAEPGCPSHCSCTSNLKVVDCKKRNLIDIPRDIPAAATTLYLGYNSLSRIPSGIFAHLLNLTRLDMNNNYINHVEEGAFEGLSNLTSLTLTHNMIKFLPTGVFKGLGLLKRFYIGQNSLESIPDLGGADYLTWVNIADNKLTSLTFPPGFRTLQRLASIIAANNPSVTAISGDDFNNVKISTVTSLDLSRCGIRTVANGTLQGFNLLQTLNLGYNPMVMTSVKALLDSLGTNKVLQVIDLSSLINGSIPVDFFNGLHDKPIIQLTLVGAMNVGVLQSGTFQCCPQLARLYLGNSQIRFVEPGAFGGLNKLSILDLSGNTMLQEIPQKLPPSLTWLFLSRCNNIRNIPNFAFTGLGNVTKLNMDHCQIEQLQNNAFQGLYNLQNLTLANNIIPSFGVKVLQPLKKLITLKLNGNKMAMISGDTSKLFISQATLKILDLSMNAMETLPTNLDIFNPLSGLEELDLHGNKLGSVVASDHQGTLFSNKPKLITLKLSDNGITSLPVALFRGVTNATRLDLSGNTVTGWTAGVFNKSGTSLVDLSYNHVSLVNASSLIGTSFRSSSKSQWQPLLLWL